MQIKAQNMQIKAQNMTDVFSLTHSLFNFASEKIKLPKRAKIFKILDDLTKEFEEGLKANLPPVNEKELAFLKAGDKIEAIKEYRFRNSCGLKEAMDVIRTTAY